MSTAGLEFLHPVELLPYPVPIASSISPRSRPRSRFVPPCNSLQRISSFTAEIQIMTCE